MNSTLQDKAWESLPKEYKEKVISIYEALVVYDDGSSTMREKRELMRFLFGYNNITTKVR